MSRAASEAAMLVIARARNAEHDNSDHTSANLLGNLAPLADAQHNSTMRNIAPTFVLIVLAVLPLLARTLAREHAQIIVHGVSEPPELTGEPKKVTKPSQADSELFALIMHLKDSSTF